MKIELKEITVSELAKPYYLSNKKCEPKLNLITLYHDDKVIRFYVQ